MMKEREREKLKRISISKWSFYQASDACVWFGAYYISHKSSEDISHDSQFFV